VQGTTLPYQSIPPFVTQDAGHVELDLGAGVHGGFWLRGARLEELDRELEPEEQSGERSEESRPPQHPSQGFWGGNGHFSFVSGLVAGRRSENESCTGWDLREIPTWCLSDSDQTVMNLTRRMRWF
jgi:hypothetical protein